MRRARAPPRVRVRRLRGSHPRSAGVRARHDPLSFFGIMLRISDLRTLARKQAPTDRQEEADEPPRTHRHPPRADQTTPKPGSPSRSGRERDSGFVHTSPHDTRVLLNSTRARRRRRVLVDRTSCGCEAKSSTHTRSSGACHTYWQTLSCAAGRTFGRRTNVGRSNRDIHRRWVRREYWHLARFTWREKLSR